MKNLLIKFFGTFIGSGLLFLSYNPFLKGTFWVNFFEKPANYIIFITILTISVFFFMEESEVE